MRTIRIVHIICLLSLALVCRGQYARLYTTQNGLKSSALYTAHFDSKGLAWVTGVATLQLFDGTTFMDVLEDNKDLSTAVFLNVMEYQDDEYWLVTSRGLQLYDLRTNHVQHFVIADDVEAERDLPLNRMIRYPKDNYALITTSGFGPYIFDMTAKKTDKELTKRLTDCLDTHFFRDVIISEDSCLWGSGIGANVFCVDLKQMKRRSLNITPEAQAVLDKYNVTDFLELRKSHNILIATSVGLLIYDHAAKQIRTLRGTAASQFMVSCVVERRNGKVLLGTDSHGIWEMDEKENIVPYPIADHNIDMTYAKVRSIDEDDEGNMIISLYQKGVLVVSNSRDNFAYMPVSPTSAQVNVACITAITADHEGNFWMCADGCGVLKSTNADLSDAKLVNDGLASPLVQDIKVDKNGMVWVCSFGGGVQCLQNGRFITPDWMQPLANILVMSMAYDPQRHWLYISTNGAGVQILDLVKHEITPLTKYGDFNVWTMTVFCDAMGILWCGTVSESFWFNPMTLLLKTITFEGKGDMAAQCFASDGRTMLIGTNEGLYRYSLLTGKAQVVLPDHNIMSIETTDSDIWTATENGIVRIDKKTEMSHTYTSFGGYYIGNFHKTASYQTPSHMIYYGADNGVIGFNSLNLKQQKQLSNTLILTSLKINGYDRNYEDGSNDNVLDQSLLYATKLDVPYDQNTLAFTFSVPNYSSPNRVMYRYKLEGYDKNWHVASANHEAYYSSLPSGSYTLSIRAYYENNENTMVEKKLDIHVGYPWYATWWAWIIYLIIAGVIVYFLYNSYQERTRQRLLLSQVRHNEQIKEAKLRMFASISHEMKSPLTMIVSPLRQLMSETSDGGASDKKQKSNDERRQSLYKVMNMNCERLMRIVKQVADIRKIDSGQFELHFSEVNFATYADEIFKTFSGYAVSKRISFVIEHANNNINIWLDKVHFEKILDNLLSNAFKFTPEGGRVIVRTRGIMKDAKDWFEIRVYNSGSWIDPKDLPHIFERFYQADNQESLNTSGSGIGLNLATELVTLHHGTISADNVDPDGVEFIMQFPLGQAHLSEDELITRDDSEKPEPAMKDMEELTEDDNTDYELEKTDEDTGEKKVRTVLIVDDDTSLCEYVRDILKEHYQIMIAYDGNSAWQQILTQRPDAVVTDIKMPVCDGIELCKRIRSNPDTDNLPIIILTSESSDRTKIYSLNLDVDHFINKPFNPLMLQGAVAHSMRVRERMMSRLRRTEVGFDYNETTIDSPDDKLFGKVIQAIKAHIDDSSFGVNELASEVGVSRMQLNRKMKERYGMSPVNFIRSYRLKQSAYLLVNNKVSISDVAYRMGFSSHPYFSNVFREYFGMSPKEFIAYYADNANDEVLQKMLE